MTYQNSYQLLTKLTHLFYLMVINYRHCYCGRSCIAFKVKGGSSNCIDIVSSFCKSWHSTANHKKSKVLIFSRRTSKTIREMKFLLDNKPLEIVQDFTYSGVKITSTGNFQNHRSIIKEKAIHALFNVSKTIDFKKLKPKQAEKLFDTLISPIWL